LARIVSAEGNLLAARKENFLAAFHQILLVERPRVHEVLQHDHDHVPGHIAHRQAGNPQDSQASAKSAADLVDPATDDEDQSPSRAPRISWLKSGRTRLVM
jgi:hypothetical protein